MVSAVAATLALTTVLLSSAFAMPVDNAVLSAMAVKDVDASDASFAAELAAATAVDANGDHHLYFHAINPNSPYDWCGEIDAVSYVPAKIFELRHFEALVTYVSPCAHTSIPSTTPCDTNFCFRHVRNGALRRDAGRCPCDPSTASHRRSPHAASRRNRYAAVTINRITLPKDSRGNAAIKLRLGKCSSQGYTEGSSVLGDSVSWFGTGGTLMGPTCAEQCGCSFEGTQPNGSAPLPPCKDEPDDPSDSSFCSLCGPDTGCPGCYEGQIKSRTDGIHLFTKPKPAGGSYEACAARNQNCRDLPADDFCRVHGICGPWTPPGFVGPK